MITGEVTQPCFFISLPEAKKVLKRNHDLPHFLLNLLICNKNNFGEPQNSGPLLVSGHILRTRLKYCEYQ